jgi:hypothetical protein
MLLWILSENKSEGRKTPSKIKKFIISVLVFLPLWLVINFLFAYDSFMGPGCFAGKDLIYWQNLILNFSVLLVVLILTIILLSRRRKIILLTIAILIPIVGY